MKRSTNEFVFPLGPSAVALGMFDGVHLGHVHLVREVIRLARAEGLASAVITFDIHPLALLRPQDAPPMLTTVEEKAERLLALKPGTLVSLPFDAAFAALSAEEFAAFLARAFDVRVAVIGFNYSFGAGGAGDAALLRRLGKKYGFAVRVLEPVCWEGEPISSSRVRAALTAGDLKAAKAMLGGPYRIAGAVEHGKRLGRTLGFPTANLSLPADKALPPFGVYAASVRVEGTNHPAVLNIGVHPTVPEGAPTIEIHLLDAAPDLYGRWVEAALEAWLRPERKFDGVEALRAQIARDVEAAKQVLGMSNDPFYSEKNQAELSRRIADIEAGTANLTVHDLIEVEDD